MTFEKSDALLDLLYINLLIVIQFLAFVCCITQIIVFVPPGSILKDVFDRFSDKKEDMGIPPAVVMPAPAKRGRKSKQIMGRVAGMGGVLPSGSDALILAHLAGGGQVHQAHPLFNADTLMHSNEGM